MPRCPRIALRLIACLLGVRAPVLAAQMAAPDTAVLEFHGFRAGARLAEVAARVQELNGGRLRCERAKVDPRISECRTLLSDPELGGAVQLWLSAVDSVTSVLMLSGEVAPDQLDDWRGGLEQLYGRVGARVQGPQWSMQWVRRGRMVRLTWRIEHGEKAASVALVDGRVLDAWGRERARRSAAGRSL
jgi:hypothetical protein